MFNIAKKLARRYFQLHPGFRRLQEGIDNNKILTARLLIDRLQQRGVVETLREIEFKVFSQFRDDGIIQYLNFHTQNQIRRFIEFGIGTYLECNTRFLLENDNWEGMVIEASKADIGYLRSNPIYWLYDLKAVCSFISVENINQIFSQNGFTGEIGLLSIDIDGNDYWVWKAISVVYPVIVVIEYNAVFGEKLAVSVPYDPSFYRYRAHYSGLYWGASLRALCLLSREKGYEFVGCNDAGNNAYFVRKDCLRNLPIADWSRGFRMSKFRDGRDKSGKLNFDSGADRAELIKDLPLVDVENGCEGTLCSFTATAGITANKVTVKE